MIGKEYLAKSDMEYINTERINRDVDKACTTLNENPLIIGCDVKLVSPAELDYFKNVMSDGGPYSGYKYSLDENKTLVMKITRI